MKWRDQDAIDGVIFNSIWISTSVAFGWILSKLFNLTSLPTELQYVCVIAISFWPGFACMAFTIGLSEGDGWRKSRNDTLRLWPLFAMTVVACLLAIISYLIVHPYSLGDWETPIVTIVPLVFLLIGGLLIAYHPGLQEKWRRK